MIVTLFFLVWAVMAYVTTRGGKKTTTAIAGTKLEAKNYGRYRDKFVSKFVELLLYIYLSIYLSLARLGLLYNNRSPKSEK